MRVRGRVPTAMKKTIIASTVPRFLEGYSEAKEALADYPNKMARVMEEINDAIGVQP